MTRSSTRQIVLASSLAVYDWSACEGEVTETAPIDVDVTTRDPYASMKIVQERDTRRMSDQHAWRLTVIRPGFIWGQGNKTAGTLSHRIGPVHVVIGPTTRIPLTHVENCASAFVAATEKNSASGGQTFNVIDGHDVSTWDYVGASLRQAGRRDWRLPIPYRLGMALVKIVDWSNRVLLRNNLSFLRVLTPRRFEARFKPLKFSNESLRTSLGWFPRHSFKECLELTYPARGRRTGVGG